MSEPIFNIFNFIQENASNMNDADFNDTFSLIATKLENDFNRRMNLFNLEKLLGYQQLKNYIQSNFDRIIGDNYTLQSLLYLLTELSLRNRANSLFTNVQGKKIIEANIMALEANHAKMSMHSLLNVITLIGVSRNVPAYEYLRGRNEEVTGLGFNLVNRVIRRCCSERISEGIRDNVSKLLTPELLNLATGEKMINKCRAFNTVAKLDHLNPFGFISRQKLGQLLKDIRSQAENHDQQSILLMIEALIYYDDATRNETLKEFYDIVTMTCGIPASWMLRMSSSAPGRHGICRAFISSTSSTIR